MRGGNRVGSGRKMVPELQRKKNRNIYISDDLYNKIMDNDLFLDGAYTFSGTTSFF